LGSDDIYGDVQALFAYGFSTRPPPGAEVLGPKAAPRPATASPTGAGHGQPAAEIRAPWQRIGWLAVPLPLVAAGLAGLGRAPPRVNALVRRRPPPALARA